MGDAKDPLCATAAKRAFIVTAVIKNILDLIAGTGRGFGLMPSASPDGRGLSPATLRNCEFPGVKPHPGGTGFPQPRYRRLQTQMVWAGRKSRIFTTSKSAS